ncbi:MAG: phosphoglucosamine mutase [Candidatus Thermoplasmatota archaeon]|jgi:phosphomannomutase/phosphoglucomutase|nr:phosphoglucosamine mutase [Candidatus Thermoplasmatota archaeon]MCL5789581.1 phosphoglucosamine mutase [Candidatus Thermoplasmatota archaeon]
MPLFGTNGIRGILNQGLNPDLGFKFGMAVGTHYEGNEIALAYDNRTTSRLLRNMVEAGLENSGKDVIDLGMIPTPAIQVYCKLNRIPGVMITASHNPPNFNGFKVIATDGTNPGKGEEAAIEEMIMSEKFKFATWNTVGSLRKEDAVTPYLKEIIKNVDQKGIMNKHFRVMVDCANSTTLVTTPRLLQKLGVEYVSVNANEDGLFPGREPEPAYENIKDLISFAKNSKFDFSVAHDGDGDRAVFLDETGTMIDGDKFVALVADHILEKTKGDLVFPVASSFLIDRIAEKHGVRVIRTPVGAPIISETLVKTNGLMGGEENGKVILPRYLNGGDGGLSVALALDIVASRGRDISNLIKELPDYKLRRIKLQNRQDYDLIKTRLKENYAGMKMDEMDGLRLVDKDNFILLRKSGTEPAIRIYISSMNSDWIEGREKEIRKLIGSN